MVVKRGEIWWALVPYALNEAGDNIVRPVLVLQSDPFNRSRIPTVLVAAVSSDIALARAPGNVRLSKRQSGLDRDAVVDVARVFSMSRDLFSEQVGSLSAAKQRQVDEGLRLILGI